MVLYPIPRVNVPVYCPNDFTTVKQASLYEQLYVSSQNITSGLSDITAKFNPGTNFIQTSLATASIPANTNYYVLGPSSFYMCMFQLTFPTNPLLATGEINGKNINGITPVNPTSPFSICLTGMPREKLYIISYAATALGTAAGTTTPNTGNVMQINLK